ncbi:MAG: FAD:protein FMN transferase [Clostridia bacterium]|nr:FAD:protein FMN transferase [Clostridia bacterium]
MKHYPATEYRHRRLLARLLAAALVLLMPIGISGCEKAEEREFFAMDAYMRIRVFGAPDGALDEAEDEIEALSALLSATDEKSEIYALNHAEGKAMTVSPDAFDIIERGLELSRELGGCFELSLRPVSRAWGFTEDENRIPPESELRELLKLVGDERIVTDRAVRTVALPAGFELDLGALAKGYAADRAKERLSDAGVSAALIDLGSSTILAFGKKPDGSKWKIAVRDPMGGDTPAGTIEFDGGAISTSGGWERYFEGPDGQVYWHIIDPRTGAPARTGAYSVTVLTDDALYGDALSTALFVMGPEKALGYYETHGDLDFIMFLEDGSVLATPGMSELFTPSGAYENARVVTTGE